MSKIDKCLKCGNQDFVNISGVKTCEKCGTQIHPKNEINDNSNNMISKENLLLTFGILLNNKKTLIVLIPLITLIFVVGACEAATKPSDLPNYGINITNINLTIHDDETTSEYSDYNETTYYSEGKLKFDVLTKGTIDSCSVKIKFFDRDNIILFDDGETINQTTSATKRDSSNRKYFDFNEYNNMLFLADNYGYSHFDMDGISLPKDNLTVTDFSIILEKRSGNGVNSKIFETPKINIGNVKVRFNYVKFPKQRTFSKY